MRARSLPWVIAAALMLVVPGTAAAQAVEPGALDAPLSALDSLLAIRITTAAKHDQTAAEAASAVTVITAEEIRRFGFQTVAQLLESVRGFYVSYDRNYTYLGVRGFGRPTDYNNRILLLVDGHTVTEGIWGLTPVGAELGIDLRSLERVEVVRGPSSTLYGTGAMLAVINLVPKSAARLDGAEVSVGSGSFGRRNVAAQAGVELAGGVGISLSALGERVDGADLHFPEYDAAPGEGIARGLDWERREGVAASVSFRELTFQVRHMNRRKGIPTGAFDVAFGDPTAMTGDAMTQVEARYREELGPRHAVTLRAYGDRYRYRGVYPDDRASSESAVADVLGAEGSVRWDPASGHSLTVGAELRSHVNAQYVTREGDVAELPIDRAFHAISVYAHDELRIARGLTAIAGARFDHHPMEGDAVSPQAALIVDAGKRTTLKALYGEAFRAPSMYESAFAIDTAGPGLGPERLRSFELVGERRIGTWLIATASLYEFRMRDLIDQAVDPVDFHPHYANRSAVRSRGAELGMRLVRRNGVSGYATYSLQVPRDLATDSILTNAPRHLAKAGLAISLGPAADVALQARYESGRRTIQDTWTDDVVLSDAHVTLSPWATAREGRGLAGAELSIGIRNVFNASFATPAGVEHRQAAIAQDGRTFTARLGWRF